MNIINVEVREPTEIFPSWMIVVKNNGRQIGLSTGATKAAALKNIAEELTMYKTENIEKQRRNEAEMRRLIARNERLKDEVEELSFVLERIKEAAKDEAGD